MFLSFELSCCTLDLIVLKQVLQVNFTTDYVKAVPKHFLHPVGHMFIFMVQDVFRIFFYHYCAIGFPVRDKINKKSSTPVTISVLNAGNTEPADQLERS